MIKFDSDYLEGAHPQVLGKLVETNLLQTPGYGDDDYSAQARELIIAACGNADVDVHFLAGGTQTNLTLIAAALRPHQCVVSAFSGHINVHETGAVESSGHKIIALPGKDGKITAEQVREVWEEHRNDCNREHAVQPKLVYISNPTELGSIYSKAELQALSDFCRSHGLYLYLDGARLGYCLAAQGNDLELADFASLCDAFYIGGTKLGALFGEALVISHPALKEDFRYMIKQRGGLVAKGRLLGLQFLALFEDDLYFRIADHANTLAYKIKDACLSKGFEFLSDSPTNQQFPVLPDELLAKLDTEYSYSFWKKFPDGRSGVRFCTSWATKVEDVDNLVADILSL
ncbi:MAG: threonine aldolase family protein [Saccharofermentanales bacterium]